MLGVYIHIPFCQSKCHYCAFASFVHNEDFHEKYIDFLIKEINNFSKDKREIDSIYIGGGTPSLLSTKLLEKLIESLKSNFIFNKNIEFTIEANPCSLTKEKLQFYKHSGINRISIGIQSLYDSQLKAIGRKHSSVEAIEKIKLASEYFDNISCDLLIGLPEMDEEEFACQIVKLSSLNVKHISCYMLQVEENTPLVRMIDNKEITLPDDDECVQVYEKATKLLSKLGYEQYEVSNFAKKGFESKHNLKYWTGEDYIGFGLGAHSYLDGSRWSNPANFENYFSGQLQTKEVLTNQQRIEEHIMLGLRCKIGISKNFLHSLDYQIEENENFIQFKKQNVLYENEDNITLNPQFYGVSNYIIASLIP